MSTFEIKAYKIEKVEPHPNADLLDIIKLEGMDYILISQKGLRNVGDVVIYCPPDSLIPEYLLRQGFWDDVKGKGMLSGSLGNRVKPKRLRGVFSEGIIFECKNKGEISNYYPCIDNEQGEMIYIDFDKDYSKELNIQKYEPTLPAHMMGKAVGEFQDLTIKYDFDSIKKDPDQFYPYTVREEEDEVNGYKIIKKVREYLKDQPDEVWISEKIHGSLIMFGICREDMKHEKFYKDRIYFSSKGLGARGIILDWTDSNNLWVRGLTKYNLFEKMHVYSEKIGDQLKNSSLLVFGEVFGSGVQDLGYGSVNGDIQIRIFDASLVNSHQNYQFLEFSELKLLSEELEVPLVPVLHVGKFSPEKVAELTDGKETVSGKNTHIREGVVVKSTKNFYDERCLRWYRKVAKSVSEAYHERKGNITEFQ